MSFKFIQKIFIFIFLLIFNQAIWPVIIKGALVKCPKTGQKVILLGDWHVALPNNLIKELNIINHVRDLKCKNPDIKVYYEGEIESELVDLEELPISFSVFEWVRSERDSSFINIENRDFLVPLDLIDSVLKDPIFHQRMFKENNEEGKRFCSQPLAHFINLLRLAYEKVIGEVNKICSKNDAMQNRLDDLYNKMQRLISDIEMKFNEYLDVDLSKLIEPRFCKLYLGYSMAGNLGTYVTSETSCIFDFNCINKIIENNNDCVVIAGEKHISDIVKLLRLADYEVILETNVKDNDGFKYSNGMELIFAMNRCFDTVEPEFIEAIFSTDDSIQRATAERVVDLEKEEDEFIKLVEDMLKRKLVADKDTLKSNLIKSIEAKDLEKVLALLEQGVSVSEKNDNGETALMIALRSGNVEIVKLLLENKVEVNEKDSDGWHALMLAALYQVPIKIVKMLLRHGAVIDERNKFGETSLIKAAEQGCLEMVKLLLANGADPVLEDNDGITALRIAEDLGHGQIVQLLKEYLPT